MEEPGAGYCPWGCKELDTTEQLHFHFSPLCWSIQRFFLFPHVVCDIQTTPSFFLKFSSPWLPGPRYYFFSSAFGVQFPLPVPLRKLLCFLVLYYQLFSLLAHCLYLLIIRSLDFVSIYILITSSQVSDPKYLHWTSPSGQVHIAPSPEWDKSWFRIVLYTS